MLGGCQKVVPVTRLVSKGGEATRCEAIFSQDVAKEGRYFSGIRYVPLRPNKPNQRRYTVIPPMLTPTI